MDILNFPCEFNSISCWSPSQTILKLGPKVLLTSRTSRSQPNARMNIETCFMFDYIFALKVLCCLIKNVACNFILYLENENLLTCFFTCNNNIFRRNFLVRREEGLHSPMISFSFIYFYGCRKWRIYYRCRKRNYCNIFNFC